MTSFKLSNRWNCIHQLIKQESTGALREFSKRIGISKSQLNRELTDMKLMGAPIEYNEIKRTYYYTEKVEFEFGFKTLGNRELMNINGGATIYLYDNLSCPMRRDRSSVSLHYKYFVLAKNICRRS